VAVFFCGKRIDAITFDFWWTLFKDADGRADTSVQKLRLDFIIDIARLYGRKVDTQDARDAFEAARQFFEENHKEGRFISPVTITRRLFSDLDIELAPHEARIVSERLSQLGIYARLILIEGGDELIRFLKNRGVRIGLISDTVMTKGRHLVWHLRKHKIISFFDYLVFSDEIGVVKPNNIVFSIAAEKLGAQPENCLHIGDFPWSDIEGAKRSGFFAVQFTGGFGPEAENIHPDADFVAKSFKEVIQLLR
jgi:putative hydrolase of the HAD superfamily